MTVDEILDKAGDVRSYLAKDEEEALQYFEHYGIYNNEGDCSYMFCTRCQNYSAVEGKLRHKKVIESGCCGSAVTTLNENYSRSWMRQHRNVCSFKRISDTEVIAVCYTLYIEFAYKMKGYFNPYEDGIFNTFVKFHNIYYLSKGESVRLRQEFDFHEGNKWVECKASNRQPVFHATPYGFEGIDVMLHEDVLKDTFLKYIIDATEHMFIFEKPTFLKLLAEYCYRPNMEYLIKGGFENVLLNHLSENSYGLRINWRSNNLKKMLHLNSKEVKFLEGYNAKELKQYQDFKKMHKASEEVAKAVVDLGINTTVDIHQMTGFNFKAIVEYAESSTRLRDWRDYLRECITLGYDLSDTMISKPKNLYRAHERTSQAIEIANQKSIEEAMIKFYEERKMFEFEWEDLIVVQPLSIQDIVNEGKELSHCVAGYAKRHATGKLHILFVRHKDAPDVPFYTMEVDLNGYIVQCRGFRNDMTAPKDEHVIEFEKVYQKYLKNIFKRKRGKSA